MEKDLAKALQEILEWVGQEAEIITYSGRNMFGKETYGVKFEDDNELFIVFYELGRRYDNFLDDIEKLKIDRLGKYFILY